MSNSLKEALEASGIVGEIKEAARTEEQAAKAARMERNAKLSPHQRWWQNFRMTATQFEIRVFIKVQCNKWLEGIDFIAARNLNRVTTRCRTKEEAIEQLKTKIMAWQQEQKLQDGVEPPPGTLLYWRIYG